MPRVLCGAATGSIAEAVCAAKTTSPATITIEHPSGMINVIVDYACDDHIDNLGNAGGIYSTLSRACSTARKLAAGTLFISS